MPIRCVVEVTSVESILPLNRIYANFFVVEIKNYNL